MLHGVECVGLKKHDTNFITSEKLGWQDNAEIISLKTNHFMPQCTESE